jgi:arsenical pump membrane protein
VATAASVLVLAAVLVLVAWGRVPDLLVTLPAAVLVVAVGLVSVDDAVDTLDRLAPTIGFLAAIFVVAEVARDAGLFDALGAIVARRSHGSAARLVVLVSGAAIAVTAFMSLDATAVFLTPVVIRVVRARGAKPAPPLLATAQLANASSGILPVSNLTNLLVFSSTGLTFGGFAARMVLPTVCASAVVVVTATRDASAHPRLADDIVAAAPRLGTFARAVLAGIVALFVACFATSAAGGEPAIAALVVAALVATGAILAGRVRPRRLAAAASPSFLAFVAGLGIVVQAAVDHGLGDLARDLLPSGATLGALLAVAGIAAVLANLVNNLPATLLLSSVVPAHAPATLLALLVGVNIGPNLGYPGSLATLLWRRAVREEGIEPSRRAFYRLGVLTTPVALVLATAALWLSLQVVA